MSGPQHRRRATGGSLDWRPKASLICCVCCRGLVDFRSEEPEVPKDHPFATKAKVRRVPSNR